MAEKITINLPGPDGVSIPVDMPAWALEETQLKLLAAADSNKNYNEDSKKALEKLVGHIVDGNKNDKKDSKEANKDRDKAGKALNDIAKNTDKKNNKGGKGGIADEASDSLGMFAKALTYVSGTVIGTLVGGFASVVSGSYGLGKVLSDLSLTGVGFDTTLNESANAIAGLNQLGMTTKQAAGLMAEYSGIVQTVGKPAFVQAQREFAKATGFGSEFGMTMHEASTVLAEELETRQQLGILGKIDAIETAKRTKKLYKEQFLQTQLLGKSIDDIRGASEKTLADQATVKLAFIRATQTLGPEAAEAFRVATASSMSNLKAVGVSQEVIDQMGMAMFDVNAFQSEGAQAMREALMATGTSAGREIEGSLLNINKMIKAGDTEGAAKEQAKLSKQFIKLGEEMAADGGKGAQRFQSMLATLGQTNPMVEMIASMQPDLLRAAKKLADGVADEVNQMAIAAATFDNAKAMLSGAFEGIETSINAALGKPLSYLADAFTNEGIKRGKNNAILDKNGKALLLAKDIVDANGKVIKKQGEAVTDVTHLTKEQQKQMVKTPGIMSVFNDAMDEIRKAFIDLLMPVTEADGEVKDFAQVLRDKLSPMIKSAGETVANFIRTFDFKQFWEDTKSTFNNVKDGFNTFIEKMKVLGGFLSSVGSALKSLATFIYDFTGNDEKTSKSGIVMERNGEAVALTDTQQASVEKELMTLPAGPEQEELSRLLRNSAERKNEIKQDVAKEKGISIDEVKTEQLETAIKDAHNDGAKTAFERINWLKIGGLIVGGMAVKKGIGVLKDKLFGGATAKGPSGIGSDNGKGLGKSIANVGKGIGKGLGGIIAGFFTAFTPAAVAGAAFFAAAVAAASLGIGAASVILGKSLPVLAEGLKSFEGIDGMNLAKVAGGMAALGGGLAAFGAGAAVGAVGGTIAGLLDLLPGKSPLEKLKEFADADIGDVAKITSNAEAMVAFGAAMAAYGGGQAVAGAGGLMEGIGSFVNWAFGGDSPLEKVKKFGEEDINAEGVSKNASALLLFSDAMTSFNGTMNEGISDTAIKTTIAQVNSLSEAYERLAKVDTDKLTKLIPVSPQESTLVDNTTAEKMGFGSTDTVQPSPASQDLSAKKPAMASATDGAPGKESKVEELLTQLVNQGQRTEMQSARQSGELIDQIKNI
jgi:hypothetical protein